MPRSVGSRFSRGRRLVAAGAAAAGLVSLALTVGPSATAASADPTTPLYLDRSQPVNVRVADLLGRMTLDEKVGQMTQAERGAIDKSRQNITTGTSDHCCPAAGRLRRPTTRPRGPTWWTLTSRTR